MTNQKTHLGLIIYIGERTTWALKLTEVCWPEDGEMLEWILMYIVVFALVYSFIFLTNLESKSYLALELSVICEWQTTAFQVLESARIFTLTNQTYW